ncbi:MAG TPA: hypothetical protein VGL06_26235, partial [Pseudonocardiaceae bacterium]
VVAGLLLLTACGGNPPTPKAAQSHPRPAPTASPTPAPTPTLYPQVADAYKAAAAANPHVNFDLCTATTPLTDRTCGAVFTAASNVATATERKLNALDPVTYAPVTDVADKFVTSLDQLELPIPCYGLGSASPPPPQLVAQAQAICAEAAAIAKTGWNIFLSEIDILSGYQPS